MTPSVRKPLGQWGLRLGERGWRHCQVLSGWPFATVPVVGSNNNVEVRDPHAVAEFFERDRANIAWIECTFEQARRVGAQALVFAMRGHPFEFKSAWEDFLPHRLDGALALSALCRLALGSGRPGPGQ